ncbi:DUF4174 domain-containing protein [Salinisphaera sp. T31B1]|uniref:DUF4174 domain-containing protein n=1 Tax=Salinisphaera sp. T31B1 TaxID=727963 RepID=UPI0033405C6D
MRSVLLIGLLSGLIGTAHGAGAASLSQLQWQYRVIVVFAPTDTEAADHRDTLARSAGIADRDIAWFVLGPTGPVVSNIEQGIDREALVDLHAADGFETVLIGKDGGVKTRQTETFDLPALFGEIDRMPMRQNEMQQ